MYTQTHRCLPTKMQVTITITIMYKNNMCYDVCIVLHTCDGKAHPQPGNK